MNAYLSNYKHSNAFMPDSGAYSGIKKRGLRRIPAGCMIHLARGGKTLTYNDPIQKLGMVKGRLLASGLGLAYYNYRHYNPLDGRWCGRDPQDDFYPLFLYDYCFNNPVNYIDIRGESGLCQDYLWFGGTCINNSSHGEYALYDSEWYLLKPGQSTPYNKDCDGMTCGGKYYAVKGIIAFASNTATCNDSGLEKGSAIVEWDGKDNSSENRHSPVGSGASDLPPNMK